MSVRRYGSLLLLGVALSGCAARRAAQAPTPSPLPSPPAVVAEWKGGKLARERLERRVRVMLASAGVRPSDPGAGRRAQAFAASQATELVSLLLLDQHQRQQPKRLRISVEAEVEHRWRRAIGARGKDRLLESLRAWGVGEPEAREELRLEALRDLYLEALAAEEPVGEEFVRREYERNRHLYRVPDRYRLKGIVTDTREEAEKALAEILAGRDFAVVARKYSKDARTAARGGDVGWLDEARMHPWLLQAVRQLRKGQVSRPFAGPGRWYVVRLEDARPGRPLSYEEARPRIVREFKQAAARTTLSALLARLRKEKGVRQFWPSAGP